MFYRPKRFEEYAFERRRRRRGIEDAKRKRDLELRRMIKLVRVEGEIQVYDPDGNLLPYKVKARVFCTDVSPSHIRVFAEEPVAMGRDVVLTLGGDYPLEIRGRVIQCSPYALETPVHADQPMPFRIAITFTVPTHMKGVERFVDYSYEFARRYLRD